MIPPRRRDRPAVVVFYHRPIDDPYHGGSRHCRGFVDGLGRHFPVAFVGPPYTPSARTGRDRGGVRLAVVAYLIRATLDAMRFIIEEGLRPAHDRPRVLIAFDTYQAAIAAVWSRIRRTEFVYYPQDASGPVTEGWSKSGITGARLLKLMRALPEQLGISAARLILVPSEAVRESYAQLGVPPDRLRVCTLKRDVPPFSRELAREWQRRLGSDGRVSAVFVGSFQYPPNVRAFEFLRSTLAPELLRRGSDVQIVVAGLDSEPFATRLPENLRVLGTVDDLDGLLYSGTLGLAPMDVPGGTSGKIVDYLLHGLPTLATPESAQGVAPSSMLKVVPLADFPQAVAELATALRSTGGSDVDHLPDPGYVERYTHSEDLDAVAAELKRRHRLADP